MNNQSKPQIRMKINSSYCDIILKESSPKTRDQILNELPIKSIVRTWEEEIYFSIPVKILEENAKDSGMTASENLDKIGI